jgi:hypothetical protein
MPALAKPREGVDCDACVDLIERDRSIIFAELA